MRDDLALLDLTAAHPNRALCIPLATPPSRNVLYPTICPFMPSPLSRSLSLSLLLSRRGLFISERLYLSSPQLFQLSPATKLAISDNLVNEALRTAVVVATYVYIPKRVHRQMHLSWQSCPAAAVSRCPDRWSAGPVFSGVQYASQPTIRRLIATAHPFVCESDLVDTTFD